MVGLGPGGGEGVGGVEVVVLRVGAGRGQCFLLEVELLVDGFGIDGVFGDLEPFVFVLLDVVELFPEERLHLLLVFHVFEEGGGALELLHLVVLQLEGHLLHGRTVNHHPKQLVDRVDVLASVGVVGVEVGGQVLDEVSGSGVEYFWVLFVFGVEF